MPEAPSGGIWATSQALRMRCWPGPVELGVLIQDCAGAVQ